MKILTNKKQPGFTLIEALVVITIIAILAALGFSGIRNAKARATAAIDANDLRQIGAAVPLYAEDKNGLLPTTSGGVGAIYLSKSKNSSLLGALIPYLGYDEGIEGEFYDEFAAANWQSEKNGENAPSLLVMHRVYSGSGKPDNISRPSPNITPFGYPFPPGKRAPMTLSAAISNMASPGNCLMLTEVDRLHPNFRGSSPGWLEAVPDGMAHGTYRLGLFWDGHVGMLDIDLNPK